MKLIVGAELYPDPADVTETAVTAPTATANALAPVPVGVCKLNALGVYATLLVTPTFTEAGISFTIEF